MRQFSKINEKKFTFCKNKWKKYIQLRRVNELGMSEKYKIGIGLKSISI